MVQNTELEEIEKIRDGIAYLIIIPLAVFIVIGGAFMLIMLTLSGVIFLHSAVVSSLFSLFKILMLLIAVFGLVGIPDLMFIAVFIADTFLVTPNGAMAPIVSHNVTLGLGLSSLVGVIG
ncbi:hypothetical protein, partial [Acidianus sp. RZ1]|uniref:hypothetical protein n=1 Tax=Acidianus sp. RZ1 TaxID=1540082 RepID=UPI0017A38BF3